MSILFLAMLASSQPLPFIDRTSLDQIAKIEALQSQAAFKGRQPVKKLLARNLRMTATVCGAASKLADPAAFLSDVGGAYAMSPAEVSALRETCAVYLYGRMDAERSGITHR